MKEQREFNGERRVFSINGSETPGLSSAKKKVKKEERRKKEGKTRNLDTDLSQK